MRRLIEQIDNLLVEKRLSSISFEDMFGSDRKIKELLDEWVMEGSAEYIIDELMYELELEDLSPDRVRQSDAFSIWKPRDHFLDVWGYEEEVPWVEDYEEFYRAWLNGEWGGFEYDGKWYDKSAVDLFAEENSLSSTNIEVTDTQAALDWFKRHLFSLFHETTGNLQMQAVDRNGDVHIWREMTVRVDWIEHLAKQGKRLGVYWTWSKGSEKAYWGDGSKPSRAVVHAVVDERYVNWESSIYANLHPSRSYEREITLFKNTPLEIEWIEMDGQRVELPPAIKNKTFKA